MINNPFYTHREYLQQELDNLLTKNTTQKSINILELGVGDGSSELMHSFAKNNMNVSILGLESNSDWANTIKEKYTLSNYKILYILDWNIDTYKNILNNFYDLVFIDQSPWSARIDSLIYLSNNDKFNTAILHDYDYYNPDHCRYCHDEQSFFRDYIKKYNLIGHFKILPPTLIFKKK